MKWKLFKILIKNKLKKTNELYLNLKTEIILKVLCQIL